MGFRDILLTTLAALLTGCTTYEIPKFTRLEMLAQEEQLQKVNPHQVFPPDHKFPKYEDHFFYFLYHLEKKHSQYYLAGKELPNFFDQQNLESFIPLDSIEMITKKRNILTFHNQEFDEVIPGTLRQVSLKASKNLEFKVKTYNRRLELFLRKGTLRTDTSALAQKLTDFKDFPVQYIGVTKYNIFFGKLDATFVSGNTIFLRLKGVEYDLIENKAEMTTYTTQIEKDVRVAKPNPK